MFLLPRRVDAFNSTLIIVGRYRSRSLVKLSSAGSKPFVPVCTPPVAEKVRTGSFNLVTYQSVPIIPSKAERRGGKRARPVGVTNRIPS